MHELSMHNGRVVPAPDIRLQCVRCRDLTDYERREGRIYCAECGKAHSEASLVDANTPLGGRRDP